MDTINFALTTDTVRNSEKSATRPTSANVCRYSLTLLILSLNSSKSLKHTIRH
jgi:hypothetical protein